MSKSEQFFTYRLALYSKVFVLAVVGPLIAIAAFNLAPEFKLASAITALGSAALGLSPVWFFIGTGRPSRILYSDTLQRILLTAVGGALLLAGQPLVVLALTTLLSGMLAPTLGYCFAKAGAGAGEKEPGAQRQRVSGRSILMSYREQSAALVGRAFSATYISLPIAIVTIASPASVPLFAAAERLQRMGLGVLQSIPNSMQGWVGEAKGTADSEIRVRKSIVVNCALGVVTGLGFWLTGPALSHVIFTGTATIPYSLSGVCGVVVFLTCVSRATGGLALVARDRIRAITYSAAAGGIIGLAAIAILASSLGAVGGMLGEVAAEATVLIVQILFLCRR
jgi:hypothetical protein